MLPWFISRNLSAITIIDIEKFIKTSTVTNPLKRKTWIYFKMTVKSVKTEPVYNGILSLMEEKKS